MVQDNQYGAVIIRIKDADRPVVLEKRTFNWRHVRALKPLYPVGQELPGQPKKITFNDWVLVKWEGLSITTRVND